MRTVTAQAGPAYELVDAVNQFRAQNGLPALQVDASLMTAAQGHAAWMAANHHYSHTGEGGSTPQSRANAAGYAGTVYENVEGGTDLTARNAVYWWQQDSIHLTTMLLPHHVHIGVGYAANEDQKLFVLMIGQPSKDASAARHATPVSRENHTSKPFPMVPIVVSTPRADGAVVHIVQQGQTAWAIAARYGIDLAELLRLNHLQSGAVLHVGDSILIRPGSGQSISAAPTLPTTHIVQPGETIWAIAARSGISVNDLLALNHLTRGAILQPGDTLVLRQAVPTSTAAPTEVPTSLPTVTPTASVVIPTITRTIPTTSIRPIHSPSPAVPTLTQTPGADIQARQPAAPLTGILIAGIGLVGVTAGTILITYRRWRR